MNRRADAGDRATVLLLGNLDQFDADLADGALVVIGDNRIRIRRLPINR